MNMPQQPMPGAPPAGAPAPGLQPAGGPPLTKAGQKALQNLDLLPGESIQYVVQGDGFFAGTNPAAKAAAMFAMFMTKITGGHIRIFVVVTNQRIVLINSAAQWCGCAKNVSINAVALASLAEAGWAKQTQYCFVHTRQISLETKTQAYSLFIKKLGDPEMREFVSNLSAVMVANAGGAKTVT